MKYVYALLMMIFSMSLNAAPIPEFSAKYEVYYGDYSLGTGRYELAQTAEDQYKFSFVSKMRFFLMFTDKRWVSSTFEYKDDQILPIRYEHKREGTGPNYYDVIKFDAAANLIDSVHKKDHYKQDYNALIRDGLSVQLQLMLDLRRGVKHPKYLILDENELKEREFSFIKEETLKIEGKVYDCVLYQVVRSSNSRKTQMWFSIKDNYQPVMMAHYSKEKKRFNARLVSYHEEKAIAVPEKKPLKEEVSAL